MEQQACPLCDTQAVFELADFGKRKRFLCNQCGRFVITTGAELRLAESIPSWLEELKERIHATPEGKILEIRLTPVHNRQEGVGYQALDTEYILQ